MWSLIADAAATMDAGAVGQMLATLIGAGVVGGGGYAMGKARKIAVSPDPLNVRKTTEYATKDDIDRLEREINGIKAIHRDGETKLHDRINDMATDLASLDGKMDIIINRIS